MSSDGNLEPGWLNRQIERVHEEARARRIALEWARQHGASIVPAYNGSPSVSVEEGLSRQAADAMRGPSPLSYIDHTWTADERQRFAAFVDRLRSDGRVPGPQGATIEFQVERQDNRCMDTVARSMVEKPKFLGCTNVEDIPFGEYEFMVGGSTTRFTVQCRTIVGDERLVHVVYNQKPSCLGIARFPRRSLCVACVHGNFYAGVNRVKIISQHISPPTPTSHVRRVEL